MLCRSPVAALTASESVCFCTCSSRSTPSSTRLPKSTPLLRWGPDGPWREPVARAASIRGATYGVKPVASIPGTLMSLSDLQGAAVGVLGDLGDLHRGLVAALSHHQLGHLARHVHRRRAHVAVRIGQRVFRRVLQDALRVAERDAAHLDTAAGPGLGDDHLCLEGVL